MKSKDNRKYPRKNHCAPHKIIELTSNKEAVSNSVISKNVSASGLSFCASKVYEIGSLLLVHLDDPVDEDLAINRAQVLRYGSYCLARVVWNKTNPPEDNKFFEMGCAFLGLEETGNHLDLFTHLVNLDTADELREIAD